MFFTRLPLWRIVTVPREAFAHATDYWPLVGWVTGGVMVGTYWGLTFVFPPEVALIGGLAARLLLTGALHEDGLADFADGMGGGTTRERTLSIMKDSHIGTYGVLALILYLIILYSALNALEAALPTAAFVGAWWTADVWGKAAASWLTDQLPYARTEATAKSGVVYERRRGRQLAAHCLRIVLALVPCLAIYMDEALVASAAVALTAEWLLMRWMRRRLQGYTGDCCGATFLLCELAFLLTFLALKA